MDTTSLDLSGAKILLVDDNPENLKVLRQALEPEGYSILIATNGETATKLAENAQPELLLLDVQMPGIDGFETCRRLKKNASTRSIPVIFVTARTELESLIQGFQVGGVDYIAKPFHREEVLIRVQTHLKIERLGREIQAGAERKARFLANVSHEIRNPMTAIMGYLDLMLGGFAGELNEKQHSHLNRIKHSADYLLNLVNDLLDLHKIEAGYIDVNPSPFSIHALINTCCATLQTRVKPQVNLIKDIQIPVENMIKTDEMLLRQIAMNLLSNALKFTDQGSVTISAELENNVLVLAVSDTGIGIPPESLETIFEEFQQVKGANRKHKGTGLGLAITRKLSHCLGGIVGVESKLGQGSVFTVRIPAVCEKKEVAILA